ncbi:hypothetical protein [Mesorhizobium sp. M1143]|uniref:hypothetical protein n=1 Tax=Mesorhizobium sp. M1143 TaxID=2957061 RepID=UPI003335F7AD
MSGPDPIDAVGGAPVRLRSRMRSHSCQSDVRDTATYRSCDRVTWFGSRYDALFLFTEDICGEAERLPRHAKAYGNLHELKKRVQDERVRALRAFRDDVGMKAFPGDRELSKISDVEFEAFVSALDAKGV